MIYTELIIDVICIDNNNNYFKIKLLINIKFIQMNNKKIQQKIASDYKINELPMLPLN